MIITLEISKAERVTDQRTTLYVLYHHHTNHTYSKYKHSLTFCVRSYGSQQRNLSTDCKSAQ